MKLHIFTKLDTINHMARFISLLELKKLDGA